MFLWQQENAHIFCVSEEHCITSIFMSFCDHLLLYIDMILASLMSLVSSTVCKLTYVTIQARHLGNFLMLFFVIHSSVNFSLPDESELIGMVEKQRFMWSSKPWQGVPQRTRWSFESSIGTPLNPPEPTFASDFSRHLDYTLFPSTFYFI